MENTLPQGAYRMLAINTLAFTVCFGVWMLNGVLVTFLASNEVFQWGPAEIGWLLGIPVLSGSIFRLPAGMLTDRYGGRPVMTGLLLLCTIPLICLSFANSFWSFALCSIGFGLAGVSFSIGVAFTSVWFPKNRQGTALGIFGAGNAGASLSTLFAPTLLNRLTLDGTQLEGWRKLPLLYAGLMLTMAIIFFWLSKNKKPAATQKTFLGQLSPLKDFRVWRFGLYYFLVFGCFVAFSQWLVPYFVNVYYMPLVTAGILASLFSFPSGAIRALGGWLSDKWGGRQVIYWVLGISAVICFLLIVPKMEITSPGRGIQAPKDGTVTAVSEDKVVVGDKEFALIKPTHKLDHVDEKAFLFPAKEMWQEPVVMVGQQVKKKELLAKGVTKIHFQANVWVFAVLVIIVGIAWGIGKAAVYKFIPEYYPDNVGVVGGMVGVIGGLGGFVCPILFGYLLEGTGLWTSCWMLMFFLSVICLLWLNHVVHRKKNVAPQS
jgi:MFS transporter, NNP family, nitrate/nitrite transporter